MLIIPLNLDSVLLLLHNSKLAYSKPIKLQVDCGATVCIIPKSLIGETQIEYCNVSLEMWNKVKMKAIAQNFTTHPGLFLSLVALSLKSCESKDTKQLRKWPKMVQHLLLAFLHSIQHNNNNNNNLFTP